LDDTPMIVPADDGSLEPADQARPRRRRLLIRVLIATAAAVVLLVGGATGLVLA
jgi:hypothetical protein